MPSPPATIALCSPTAARRREREESPSPPRSVKQVKRLINGLKTAQAVPGQEPAAKALHAQELDGAEYDLAYNGTASTGGGNGTQLSNVMVKLLCE